MRIDKKLTLLREKNGYTVKEVAVAAGVRVKTMEQYESGKAIPNIKTIMRIAEFYGYSTGELFAEAMDHVEAIIKDAAMSMESDDVDKKVERK